MCPIERSKDEIDIIRFYKYYKYGRINIIDKKMCKIETLRNVVPYVVELIEKNITNVNM